MFGPNTIFDDCVSIDYTHRDTQFFKNLEYVRNKFKSLFHLEDYDILLIPGSGTVGIESVMFSLNYNLNLIGADGTFTNRWKQMQETYHKDDRESLDMYCLLETSVSTYFSKEGCIVDAISAFPYYSIPKGTKCFITCLNKQLGSYVGVAVVGIRKDCWHLFENNKMSYLNLNRYKEAHEINQTPSTFPTFILEHFIKVLDNFDLHKFRAKISSISNLIVEAVGKENVIGDLEGPVITIPKKFIPLPVAHAFQLYGLNCDRPNYQIFTYSEDTEFYYDFVYQLNLYKRKTIAIDFDDTITEPSDYPIMGKIKPEAIEVIKKLKEKYRLILWTCREGSDLNEAVDALKKHGIFFDFINECPQGSRKVLADYYIDDKSFGGTVDWKIISEKLL